MSTAHPSHRDVRRPVDLESLTRGAQAQLLAVRARLADVAVLAEAMTDPWVGRRVVIDQAVDLRRSLLGQAEQASRALGGPGWSPPRSRNDGAHEQVAPAVLQARTGGAVLLAALAAASGAVRPLAEALVDQADINEVADRAKSSGRRNTLSVEVWHVLSSHGPGGWSSAAGCGSGAPAGDAVPGQAAAVPGGRAWVLASGCRRCLQ